MIGVYQSTIVDGQIYVYRSLIDVGCQFSIDVYQLMNMRNPNDVEPIDGFRLTDIVYKSIIDLY